MKPKVFYFYDALCGWCYGFSPVIHRLLEAYATVIDFEIISGGMVLHERAGIVNPQMSQYILNAIPQVTQLTGVSFGEPFKAQLQAGTRYQNSWKPSLALTAYKKLHLASSFAFATAMQRATFVDGLNLEDDSTYVQILAHNAHVTAEQLFEQMAVPKTNGRTQQGFDFTQQLGVQGFPALFAQIHGQYYQLTNGYASFEQLQPVMEKIQAIAAQSPEINA